MLSLYKIFNWHCWQKYFVSYKRPSETEWINANLQYNFMNLWSGKSCWTYGLHCLHDREIEHLNYVTLKMTRVIEMTDGNYLIMVLSLAWHKKMLQHIIVMMKWFIFSPLGYWTIHINNQSGTSLKLNRCPWTLVLSWVETRQLNTTKLKLS